MKRERSPATDDRDRNRPGASQPRYERLTDEAFVATTRDLFVPHLGGVDYRMRPTLPDVPEELEERNWPPHMFRGPPGTREYRITKEEIGARKNYWEREARWTYYQAWAYVLVGANKGDVSERNQKLIEKLNAVQDAIDVDNQTVQE